MSKTSYQVTAEWARDGTAFQQSSVGHTSIASPKCPIFPYKGTMSLSGFGQTSHSGQVSKPAARFFTLLGETRDTLPFVTRCFLTLLSNTSLHVLVQHRSSIWSCAWAAVWGVPAPVQGTWLCFLCPPFKCHCLVFLFSHPRLEIIF